MMIKVKRVYDPAASEDGYRVLVDKLWPRGVSKEDAALDEWMKEIAPSDALRRWFDHDPEKWKQFCERYGRELDRHQEAIGILREKARDGTVTLLYSARDTEHNNAVALEGYLLSTNASGHSPTES